MEYLKKCKICGNGKIRFLFEQEDKNLGLNVKTKLFECEKCKVIFPNPFPNKKETTNYYPSKNYYSLARIDETSNKTKLKIAIYASYAKPSLSIKSPIILLMRSFFRSLPVNSKGKLLDIGCGSGQFLYEAKKIGFDCYGLEPGEFDKQSAENNKLKIINSALLKKNFSKETFDIVTINHVLEHIDEPLKFLSEVSFVTKKEGTILIGVPNTSSLARLLFGKNWYQLDTPRHLLNYNPVNLETVVKKAGLKVINIRYNSRPSQFSVSLRYLLGYRKNGFIEKIINLLAIIPTYLVNILHLGDQIEIYCKKDKVLN